MCVGGVLRTPMDALNCRWQQAIDSVLVPDVCPSALPHRTRVSLPSCFTL